MTCAHASLGPTLAMAYHVCKSYRHYLCTYTPMRFVHIYIYIYIYTHTYTYTCVYVYIYIYVQPRADAGDGLAPRPAILV